MVSRQHLSRWSALAAILASFALACLLARALSTDLTLLLFLLPIGLLLYGFGPFPAYAVCPLAVLTWRSVHQPLAPAWSSPWSILALTLLFGFFILVVSRQQRRSRQLHDQQRQLTALLPLCPNCGQLLCHDSQWRTFEQLLQNPPLAGSLPHHPCITDGPTDRRE